MKLNSLRKWILLPAALLASAIVSYGQEAPRPVKDSLEYEGQVRYHYLYVPDTLLPQRPLVMLIHGYGGQAEGYRPEMLEVARREGFALCIPQGLKAPEGKTGWYAGYPAQKGMRKDDDAFICFLARTLAGQNGFQDLFLTGMSNGGEMCYIIGRKYPGAFRAIASVAGLTMKWVADSLDFHGPVPFMEVHGTADKTSRWDGDLENEGGWGAYIAVPDAVQAWVRENGCTVQEEQPLPLLKEGARQVILHRWSGGLPAWPDGPASEVLLYEVQGGKHSWALADMDTCSAIWDFFRKWLHPCAE